MTQNPIENPVINSPYVEPAQHFVSFAADQLDAFATILEQAVVAVAPLCNAAFWPPPT